MGKMQGMARGGTALVVMVLLCPAMAKPAEENSPGIRDPIPGSIRFTVCDGRDGKRLPCRIYVADVHGWPQRCAPWPFAFNHFTCEGEATLELNPGRYTYEVECGMEYKTASGVFTVESARTEMLNIELVRFADLAAEGWYAGDLHNHRSAEEMPLLMRAENIHVGYVLAWWANTSPDARTFRAAPGETPVVLPANRFLYPGGGEDERLDGTVIYFGLPRDKRVTDYTWDYPPILDFMREAMALPDVWIHVDRPYWWELPAWLALGRVDSIEVFNNNLTRSNSNDTEAWGRPRNREVYPPPHGNALYCQDLYFHVLNCGFRIPPAAGSASGVAGESFGYNRVYVKVDGILTWKKWWDGLRQGRCFVTNGPLLRARANGEWPGHIFRTDGGQPFRIRLDMDLDTRDEITCIELVHNGKTVLSMPFTAWKRGTPIGPVTLSGPGWFLLRVHTAHPSSYRGAMTGAWYLEAPNRERRISRESTRLFLEWAEQAAMGNEQTDPEKGSRVKRYHDESIRFWRNLHKRANAD